MDWPDLLPPDMDFLLRLRGEEQIIPTLVSHSDEYLVRFFEVSSSDETWTQEHRELTKAMLEFFTQEYSSTRLRLEYGERIVKCIHWHIDILRTLLPKDLRLITEGGMKMCNSLLYGVQSPFFRDFIEQKYKKGQTLTLPAVDVPADIFDIVEEYMSNGMIEGLYRYPQEMLIRILQRAGQWQIPGLIQLAANVMRRYVNRDTATELLQLAQTFVLPDLKEACCDVLNSLIIGARFEALGEADLSVTVEEFRERTTQLLMEVAAAMTHLSVREHAAEAPELLQLLPKCMRLAVFDLYGSKGFDLEVVSVLPRIRELNLGNCEEWLVNQAALLILRRVSGLKHLILRENPQLSYEGFRHVADQTSLEILDCTYCNGLEDAFLTSIARGCQALTEINVSWCPKLTDVGMRSLGALRPALKIIDVSHCIKVSDAGIHDLVRPCYQLERLSMQHLPRMTEEGILKVVTLCIHLKYLDIRLCDMTDAGLATIRDKRPTLELIF